MYPAPYLGTASIDIGITGTLHQQGFLFLRLPQRRHYAGAWIDAFGL